MARPASVDESFLALPLSALDRRRADPGASTSAASTPTSGSSGSAPRRSGCATPGRRRSTDGEDLGLAVRVVHEGTWGFAAGVVLTAAEAVRLAEEAVAVARCPRR